ncbi:MAG: GYD domain-containing protein [Anaerolineaceae bacterium]|nr:GYD domain-containing protein [Anaerolineaceae bacterium]
MTTYMIEVRYNAEAWAAWIRGPHSCAPKIEAMLSGLGGRLISFWWANAAFDSLLLIELPDSAALASFRAFAASLGGIQSLQATPLLSDKEGLAAITRAGALS